MSVYVDPELAPDSEVAWAEGEAAVAVAMSAANMAAVALVEAVVDVLARGGWEGWGIQSPVHWLCWKANVSHRRPDGSEHGEYDLPPEHAAIWEAALAAARDAEFRDRNDLPADAQVDGQARQVTWLDAAVRMAGDALDADDAVLQRTGHPGERHQIVLHHQVDPDEAIGPGRLHLGGIVSDSTARYFACDARVIVAAWRDGKLVALTATDRSPNRRLRRVLEHRDGGCAHPLCLQKRWLHAHHIKHWEDGGLTVASNLVMLCPTHHRQLHAGDLVIEGSPQDGTLTFRDRHGRPIEPPDLGAHLLPQPPAPTQVTYTQPYGGRLSARDFTWN